MLDSNSNACYVFQTLGAAGRVEIPASSNEEVHRSGDGCIAASDPGDSCTNFWSSLVRDNPVYHAVKLTNVVHQTWLCDRNSDVEGHSFLHGLDNNRLGWVGLGCGNTYAFCFELSTQHL